MGVVGMAWQFHEFMKSYRLQLQSFPRVNRADVDVGSGHHPHEVWASRELGEGRGSFRKVLEALGLHAWGRRASRAIGAISLLLGAPVCD